jgi:hypothetical protein
MSTLASATTVGNAHALAQEKVAAVAKPTPAGKQKILSSSHEPLETPPLKTPPLKTNVTSALVPVNIRPFGLGGSSAIEAQFREAVLEPPKGEAPPPPKPIKTENGENNSSVAQAPANNSTQKAAPSKATTVARIAAAATVAGSTKIEFESSVGLNDLEKAELEALKTRDREVRSHENAHKRTGGAYAGAPNLTFARGPDNQQYAIAGEVSINTKEIPGNPQATIDKMRIVKNAALAPSRPSSQDRQVASHAEALIRAAQAELNALKLEQQQANRAPESGGDDTGFGIVQVADNKPTQSTPEPLGPTPNKDAFQPKGISISI